MNINTHRCKINFSAGLVVFLIALPLCLGIALASGAPPLSGVLAGAIGGLVIGLLSGSHVSVSGPAAGLTAIVFAAITQLGSFELFLCAVVIAGCLQLVLGLIRAGSIAEYIPIAVIEGMLAAIGITIILKEFPYALGVTHLADIASFHWGDVVITLISFFILIGWNKVPRLRNLKMVPAALVAVVISIVINEIWQYFALPLAIPTQNLVNLPVPENWQEIENLIILPDFNGFARPEVWVIGLTTTIVASIETLLCIEATDRLDPFRRITDNNQELRAQGVGNILSGLLGGLPITSVIVRSSANVSAGATHKTATITHGALLLICAITIPALLNKIPLATLATVLLIVGYRLASPTTFKHFWQKGWYQFIPFIATLVAVVFLDLLKGVAIGALISIFFILHGNMKRAYYLSREELAQADEITLELAEEVSFLNKAAIKKTLKNIQPNSLLTINAERSSYIATDVLELIEDFVNFTAKEKEIKVNLVGFKHEYDRSQSSHIKVGHSRRI